MKRRCAFAITAITIACFALGDNLSSWRLRLPSVPVADLAGVAHDGDGKADPALFQPAEGYLNAWLCGAGYTSSGLAGPFQ